MSKKIVKNESDVRKIPLIVMRPFKMHNIVVLQREILDKNEEKSKKSHIGKENYLGHTHSEN